MISKLTEPIITGENLGKKYRLKHVAERPRYAALRDVIAYKAKHLFQSHSSPAQSTEEFWALQGVSFEVNEGDVVGIIGRNGAGKSTLLKILSRVTEPTTGRVRLRGRVASLLEVGTGFHPELTGRENIYLNGAILGMSRAEIRHKIDEIVEFAEVQRFLDTPVKRYSSGMHMRLAFAVAAHLEPEILIVDEVLAVGDAVFQKKCLGKMQEVAQGGRTVLFVSHQIAAIQNLCQTGILLSQGRVSYSGPIGKVVKHYLMESTQLSKLSVADRRDRQGSGALRFMDASFCDHAGYRVQSFTCGLPAVIELVVANPSRRSLRSVRIAIGVDNDLGQRILVLSTNLAGADFPELPPDKARVRVQIPRLPLCPGHYGFTLFSSVNGEIADWVRNPGSFEVTEGDFYGTGRTPQAGQGFMLTDHQFEVYAFQPTPQ